MKSIRTLIAAVLVLAGCTAPPPVSVQTPHGVVRAHHRSLARWMADELEFHAARLRSEEPSVRDPEVDVWLTASFEPESGIAATATRQSLTGRWRIEIDPIHGAGALGHELFHVRYHDRMRDWPAILEEGLADRFGFTGDPFSDSVATDRLFAAARRRPPTIELTFEMRDGTISGTRTRIFPDDSAPPPLSLQRIGALSRWELRRLTPREHAYAYGVGYAVAVRWLGNGPLPPLGPTPRWSDIAPSSSDELERWAAFQLDPDRVRRWAIGRLAFDVAMTLEDMDRRFASPEDCLDALAFRLSVGAGESFSLNEEPAFRELLQWIWPIVTALTEEGRIGEDGRGDRI